MVPVLVSVAMPPRPSAGVSSRSTLDAFDVVEPGLDVSFDGDGVSDGQLYSCSSKVDDDTRFGVLLHLLSCLNLFIR